ncbi:MAG: chemotaxis protein CheC, partial [Dethiobacteria bacterium]|nr:chemotaxis protein CheC [Dethiobacteria bacterium]
MKELTLLEIDTIGEVGNISLGASATALSTILDRSVEITTPRLEVVSLDEIRQEYPHPCLVVDVKYIVGLEGSNLLIIKERDAIIIAAIMMG